MLTFGSLFAGIGGLDLGLERAGMKCKWQVEIDPFCTSILNKHWPEVPKYGDVRELSASDLSPVDVICGGFPCQPVSMAGRRQGTNDPRWLWPHFARLVGEMGPRYVIVENVPGILSKGGVEVLADLAEMGFDAEWGVVSAASIGAPHIRERFWLVAHAEKSGTRLEGKQAPDQRRSGAASGGKGIRQRVEDGSSDMGVGAGGGSEGSLADSQIYDLWPRLCEGKPGRKRDRRSIHSGCPHDAWGTDPADDPESGVGRVVDGFPGRMDRLKALGNAVVPQAAEFVANFVIAREKRIA